MCLLINFQIIVRMKNEMEIRIANTGTFGKPPWFDFVKNEYMACREAVGLCDYSSFTKIDLWVK